MKSVFRETGSDIQDPCFMIDDNVNLPDVEGHSIKIHVKACGLSAISNKVVNELHRKSPRLHYSVGCEVAGIVSDVGSEVTSLSIGKRVVGMVAPDSLYSGCAECCILNEYDVVPLPDEVSFTDAAGCVGDGVKAFTALHYLGHVCSGDTVLIMDGASAFGTLAIQLAQQWGAKVLTTASTDEEKIFVDSLNPSIAQVIEVGHQSHVILTSVMEETGGVGVDCVIDSGVRMFTLDEDVTLMSENYKYPVPTKHELISCLAVCGKWVTSQPDLQLDPPNSQLLHLKCASLGFLFEHMWTLSGAQHGRYQHILKDLLEMISSGKIKPNIRKTVTMDNILDALDQLSEHRVGKVVLQL